MTVRSRREFLKLAASVSGGAAASTMLDASVRRALAIEPRPGSTFLDAEHVVILMQENRSFDHAFGTLQGVRGFNDPRAVKLPGGNPVWVQTDAAGARCVPFRLNIKDTNATWMGCLPHSRSDQVDARNGGRYDGWLEAKRSGDEQYAHMPLTLGYYTREDIPFYYALADAFTICDQHFCSVLTCTTPNRAYLWTGTSRHYPRVDSPVLLLNSEIDHDSEIDWTTFPERLEDHGVSWKIYQNELYLPTGLTAEEDQWLTNFGDNPIEHFSQFKLRFTPAYRRHLENRSQALPGEIKELERLIKSGDISRARRLRLEDDLEEKKDELKTVTEHRERWSQENFDKLSARERSLHAKAFCINDGDPHYRQLEELSYNDGGVERRLKAPKGDLFHQFRKDFTSGNAPTVSWLVAPQAFSDHPDMAWFGAWYIAEALDILTQNPEVWKKTIFILTYDENDGYFDHVPPFVAPHPRRPNSGLVSPGIDASLEYVELDDAQRERLGSEARDSSIGLGYRVPMVIASPWSRGGCVCSQVFDHTSPLQFLERLLTHKTGRPLTETNITQWRRTVCGDLTSAFQRKPDDKQAGVPVPQRDAFLEGIHRAKFKQPPSNFRPLSQAEIHEIRRDPQRSALLPRQEPGVRRSCALPYELVVDGQLSDDRSAYHIRFEARNEVFGPAAAGAPFAVRAWTASDDVAIRDYAVVAGGRLSDSWPLSDFDSGAYHFTVHGPNGFFRAFRGAAADPLLEIRLDYARPTSGVAKLTGDVAIRVFNRDPRRSHAVDVVDNAYKSDPARVVVPPNESASVPVSAQRSFGWYDLTVRVVGVENFEKRYAGRVETGQWSFSDPAMGGVVA